MNIQDSRILIKRSTTAGVVPTIPASSDHTDGSWLVTDIYKGEFFINLADGIAYTRDDSGIIVLNQSISSFGAWDSSVAYATGMTVYSSGLIWYATGASTNELPGSGSNWSLLVTNTSAYSASGWNGSLYSPTQDAVRDLVETGLFKQSGNSFTANASIGTNDAFDLLFRTNNANNGVLTSDGKWGFGVTTPFANTHKSNKSLGNTSGSYAERWTNSDDDDVAWLRNNGDFYVPNIVDASGVVCFDTATRAFNDNAGDLTGDFNSKYLFSTNFGVQVYNWGNGQMKNFSDQQSFNPLYQLAFGNWVWYNQDGTLTYLDLKADDKNLGLNGNSYGSGVGVFFMANATTAPSLAPSGGGILYSESGHLNYKGGYTCSEDVYGFIIGKENVNNSWRTRIDAGDFVIEKRESGSWVEKQRFS